MWLLKHFMKVLCFSFLVTVSTFTLAQEAEHYEKALNAYQAEQYEEAYIHLKNSLQEDPNNLAAKILMGKLLLINGYVSAAELEFVEALEMGADVNLIAEPLGNAWLFKNDYARILNFENAAVLTGDSLSQWQLIVATACIRTEDYECARNTYNQVLARNKLNIAALNGLASIAMQQGHLDKAEQFLAKAFNVMPEHPLSWRLKGQLAYLRGDSAQATADLEHALSLDSTDPVALRNLVDLYIKANEYSHAQQLITDIIEETPNDPLAIILSSWLGNQNSTAPVAGNELQTLNQYVTGLTPELTAAQPMLLYVSGLANFFSGKIEQAISEFETYLTHKPDDLQAAVLLARAYMATAQSKKALKLLEKHETALLGDIESALLLGNLYLNQNKAFKAERLLNALLERNPQNSGLDLFKVKLLAKQGQYKTVNLLLDRYMSRHADEPAFLFTYSVLKLQTGRYDAALRGVNLLIQRLPENAEILNLKTGILLKQNNLTEAKSVVEEALRLKPDLFAANYNLAVIESRVGNIASSNSVLDSLLEKTPEHPESLLLKAFNAIQVNNLEIADDIYREVLDIQPYNIEARERLAQLASRNDADEAIYHLDQLLKNDFDNTTYLMNKAQLLIRVNRNEEAKKVAGLVQSLIKDDVPALLRLSKLYRQLNDDTSALNMIKRAREAQPDSLFTNLEEARLLIQTGQLAAAEATIGTFLTTHDDNPNVWLLHGDVAAAKNNVADAVAHYQKALSLDPAFDQPFVRLYGIAMQGQHEESFEQAATNVLASPAPTLLAKNLYAQYLFLTQQFDQAEAMYIALLDASESTDAAEAYNRLALMNIESDLQQALEYARKAFELDNQSATTLDTLGWVLSLQSEYVSALKLLRDAHVRDADNPTIRYHLGYTLAKLGRTEEAKKELEFAVAVDRPFYRRTQAKALLKSLH